MSKIIINVSLFIILILPWYRLTPYSQAQDVNTLQIEQSLGRGAVLPQGFYTSGAEFYILTTTGLWQFNQATPDNLQFTPFPLENVYRATLRPDGQQVAIEVFGNEVYLWDRINAPTILAKNVKSPPQYSPDGQYIAVATPSFLNVWEVASGERISGYEFGEGTVLEVAFHPTLPQLAFGTTMNQVFHWDFGEDQLLASGDILTDKITDIGFTSDKQVLALGINPTKAGLWLIGANALTHEITLNDTAVFSAQFGGTADLLTLVTTATIWVGTSSGNTVLSLSSDGHALYHSELNNAQTHLFLWNPLTSKAEIWEVASGTRIFQADQFMRLGQVLGVSSDGRSVAVTTPAANLGLGSVFIWDIAAQQIIHVLPHEGDLTDVAFSADGTHLATSTRTTLSVWNVSTGERLNSYEIGVSAFIISIAWASDGISLLFNDRTMLGRWEIGQSEPEVFSTFTRIRPLNWSDLATWGDWVAVVDNQNIVIYDVARQTIEQSFPTTNTPLGLALTPDGKALIALVDNEGLVRIDLATGTTDHLMNSKVSEFALHPNLPLLGIAEISPATNQQNNQLGLWNMDTGTFRQSILSRNFVQTLKFSPAGQWLITVENTGLVNFWRVE